MKIIFKNVIKDIFVDSTAFLLFGGMTILIDSSKVGDGILGCLFLFALMCLVVLCQLVAFFIVFLLKKAKHIHLCKLIVPLLIIQNMDFGMLIVICVLSSALETMTMTDFWAITFVLGIIISYKFFRIRSRYHKYKCLCIQDDVR